MSKKNLHIKKYLKGKFPEPEVRADDGWANMNDMLGRNLVPDTQISSVDKLKFLLKGGLGSIAVIGIATSIWLSVPEEKKKSIEHRVNIIGLDSSNSVQSVSGVTQKKLTSAKIDLKIDSPQQSIIIKEHEEGKSGPQHSERLTLTNSAASISQEPVRSKTESSGYNHSQKLHNGGNDPSKREFTKSSSFEHTKADFNVNHGQPKKIGEYSGIAERVENMDSNRQQNIKTLTNLPNNLTRYKPFSSGETEENKSETIIAISENRLLFFAKNLIPKSVRFHNAAIKQIRPVSYNQPVSTLDQKSNESIKSLSQTLHVGLEWNASSSFHSTKYILKGTDSLSKPYLLFIPGIWISKDITEKHLLRFSFYASQPFYGGFKRVQRTGSDSLLFHNNIDLIKATGINLALQYEYCVFQNIMASAGFSYSPLRKALAQNNYENYQGEERPLQKLVLNKQNINQYMRTNLISFKTGLMFSPGRYQIGINMLIPISNLSLTPTSSLKTINGQFFLRFTVR